jgi:hypothetical protein
MKLATPRSQELRLMGIQHVAENCCGNCYEPQNEWQRGTAAAVVHRDDAQCGDNPNPKYHRTHELDHGPRFSLAAFPCPGLRRFTKGGI